MRHLPDLIAKTKEKIAYICRLTKETTLQSNHSMDVQRSNLKDLVAKNVTSFYIPPYQRA